MERTVTLTLPDGKQMSITTETGTEPVNINIAEYLNNGKTQQASDENKRTAKYTGLIKEVSQHGNVKAPVTNGKNKTFPGNSNDVQNAFEKPPIPRKMFPKAKKPVLPVPEKNNENTAYKDVQFNSILPVAQQDDIPIPEHIPEERPEDDYDLIDPTKMREGQI